MGFPPLKYITNVTVTFGFYIKEKLKPFYYSLICCKPNQYITGWY